MTAPRARVSPQAAVSSPEVCNAFIALIGSEPSDPFTPEQRAAALVFWYESEVQNGGHLQYFSNRGIEEATEAVGALVKLGARVHAAVLESALASIPPDSDSSPVSAEEYVAIALEDPYGEFDQAFHEARPPLQSVLESYLESHLSAFISFDSGGA